MIVRTETWCVNVATRLLLPHCVDYQHKGQGIWWGSGQASRILKELRPPGNSITGGGLLQQSEQHWSGGSRNGRGGSSCSMVAENKKQSGKKREEDVPPVLSRLKRHSLRWSVS